MLKYFGQKKGNDANINCYRLPVVKRRDWVGGTGTGCSYTAVLLMSPQGLGICKLVILFSLVYMFENFSHIKKLI